MASVIVKYTFAVFKCLMSGKHSEAICLYSYRHKHTSIYDCKDIGLISSNNTVVCFDLGIYSVSKQGLIYPLIIPKVIFSAVVIDHILMHWSSFGIFLVVKLTKRERREERKKTNGFLQDVGCSERCGVKFCSLQQQLCKYNHFSQYPALYMKVF